MESVAKNPISIREQILSTDDLHSEKVEVAEWGVTLIVKELTGEQRASLFDTIEVANGKVQDFDKNMQGRLVAMSLYDLNGVRIFSDDDVQSLMSKSGTVLDRLSDVAMRVSGISADAGDELGKD